MYLFIYEFTPTIGTREENSTQIGSRVVLVRAPSVRERRTTERVMAQTKKGPEERSW